MAIKVHLLRFLLLVICCWGALGGFIMGGPCTRRNTAFLDTTGKWRLPTEKLTCADITSMNPKAPTLTPPPSPIGSATTLYADHMHLNTSISGLLVPFFAKVRLIDFSGNELKKIDLNCISKARTLHTLLLDDNRLRIPKKAPLLVSKTLRTLSLKKNGIRRIGSQTFRHLPLLTTLFLDQNRLKRLQPTVFESLKSLKFVHLGRNQFTQPPSLILPSPTTLVVLKGNPFNSTDIKR